MTTGLAISATYSSGGASTLPMVLVSFLVAVFLIFEARRCRFFDIWRTRARVMETCFYGPLLRGQRLRMDNGWGQVLAEDCADVYFHISIFEAAGRRLRRNYSWILASRSSATGARSASTRPRSTRSRTCGPGPRSARSSGQVVLLLGTVFYWGLLALGPGTLPRQKAVGRVHRRRGSSDRIRELAAAEGL